MHSKISELMGKINRLAAHPSFPQVSKVEFDLLMQHVRDLYDELASLKNIEIGNVSVADGSQSAGEKIADSDAVTSREENVPLKAEPVKKGNAVMKEEPVVEK